MIPAPDKGGYRRFGFNLNGTFHLGHDFNCPEGTKVVSVANGIVVDNRQINGFGSMNPHTPGGVVFIQHRDKEGREFIALYGHVDSSLRIGEAVKEGQIIGYIIKFTTGSFRCDHLHFGIWDNPNYPLSPFGYSSDYRSWVSPLDFLETRIPYDKYPY